LPKIPENQRNNEKGEDPFGAQGETFNLVYPKAEENIQE